MLSKIGEMWLSYSFWLSDSYLRLLDKLPGNMDLIASLAIAVGIGETIHLSPAWISISLFVFFVVPFGTCLVATIVAEFAAIMVEHRS